MNDRDSLRPYVQAATLLASLDFRRLCNRRDNTPAMLDRYAEPEEVLRRLMYARRSPSSEFPDRIAFLRYLIAHEALHTSCEATILDERFAAYFSERIKADARANLAAAQVGIAA
jgi:hypothetical protein